MKQTLKAGAVLAATAALLVAGMTTAQAAGRGNGYGNGAGSGWGMMGGAGVRGGQSYGMGMMGGAGAGAGVGGCLGITAASGTLTADEKSALAAMAGEEKLAHDVYVTLAAKYPNLYQFSRIANAESMHLNAIRTLLARYGIADPTAGLAVGAFTSTARTQQFTDLVAKAVDPASALQVGVTIEKLDITDLASLLKTVTAPDVKQVLTMLDRASDMHLAAFQRAAA